MIYPRSPWYRRQLALLVVRAVQGCEWSAHRLYAVARRLAPAEFETALRVAEMRDHIEDLIARRGPAVDYPKEDG